MQHHTEASWLNLVGRAASSMHIQSVVPNLHLKGLSHQTWPEVQTQQLRIPILHAKPASHNALCHTRQLLTTHQRPTPGTCMPCNAEHMPCADCASHVLSLTFKVSRRDDDGQSHAKESAPSKQHPTASLQASQLEPKHGWADLGESCFVGYFPRYMTPGKLLQQVPQGPVSY